jgi:hypothetical protein
VGGQIFRFRFPCQYNATSTIGIDEHALQLFSFQFVLLFFFERETIGGGGEGARGEHFYGGEKSLLKVNRSQDWS